MKYVHVAVFLVSVWCAQVLAQNAQDPKVTVQEVPPEAFPAATCTENRGGYLGIVEKGGKERTKLTIEEIGSFVSKRLSEGYSVALHPQESGRIYVIETCHSAKNG